MKLRLKYFLFVTLIHILFILLASQFYRDHRTLFLVAEVLILLSIAFSIHLYNAFISPIHFISNAAQNIREQDFSTHLRPVGQPEMDQLIGVYNSMIERLRQERVKKEEQHLFLEQLIEASPSAIILLDFDDRILSLNPAAESILGAGSAAVKSQALSTLQHPMAAQLQQLRRDEARIIKVHGTQIYRCHKAHFLDRGFDHHFILIEELSDEIYKAEKQAYEKVIRMMSHEVNNSVGAVNSILSSFLNLKREIGDNRRKDFVDALEVAIQRNIRLNRFMAKFAEVVRLPEPHRENADLHAILQSVQTLMEPGCEAARVAWHWQLAESSFDAEIDVQQIEQVLVNIVKNALEAIDSGGNIWVVTEIEAEQKRLIIRNDGRPIPDEQRDRLFVPFYSTKPNGQGIGLTLTREILRNHRLPFTLSSANGLTDFTIRFP